MPVRYRTVIHWFRRDLRLSDNTALRKAVDCGDRVIPVYVISEWKNAHRWTGPNRQAFLCGALRALAESLEAAGGKLIFRKGDAAEELEKLIRETKADAVFTNRSPDPYGVVTEERVAKKCGAMGVTFESCKDAVLHERREILTGSGSSYRVFTPYNKVWQSREKDSEVAAVRCMHTPGGIRSLEPPTLKTWGLKTGDATIPAPGEAAGRKRMAHALSVILPRYAETRDTPGGHTTSRLSADLRHGTIGIRELYHRSMEVMSESRSAMAKESVQTFLNELAWREFYMQILWHHPEVLDHEFDVKFRGLPWDYDEKTLQRWKDGTTGFPIVDAGMREMKETGFMHNRARMIVAMFLTKDLHQDWRAGESHFMQLLTDGEIASNNGGWQWSAGTGADAAPWFRIQNPWSQTQRYDPHGKYIRQWVPELKDAPLERLLEPPQKGPGGFKEYPPPMVDHAVEREKTLAIFKKHRAKTH